MNKSIHCEAVSTHSRLKAAAGEFGGYWPFWVSTHSRLKAAAERGEGYKRQSFVSTHSRLKAAVHNEN